MLDRAAWAAWAADNGNFEEVFYCCKAPLRIKLDNGQWTRTPDEAAEQRRLQYGATFKGQMTTRAELARDTETRAASKEACWGTTPPTLDQVLDLILSSEGQGTWCRWYHVGGAGAGGRPMAQLLQPLSASVCLQRVLRIMWPSGKNKTKGVMLNDHVGKVLGRRIVRPKILQIEPLLVARSQATGSARRGAVMSQFATRLLFDGARIRGLSAAAVFCDLLSAYHSVVRQYVVGTDLPEQRLLVLMDILGPNLAGL